MSELSRAEAEWERMGCSAPVMGLVMAGLNQKSGAAWTGVWLKMFPASTQAGWYHWLPPLSGGGLVPAVSSYIVKLLSVLVM